MFRATMCPSSGDDDCVMFSSPVGIVPWLQEGCQDRLAGSKSIDEFVATNSLWMHYLPTSLDSLPAATAQYQYEAKTSRSRHLLMMGTWLHKTCWATSRREIKNTQLTSSWFFLSTLNYDARSTTHQIHCPVLEAVSSRGTFTADRENQKPQQLMLLRTPHHTLI